MPDAVTIDGISHEIFEFERPKRHHYIILEVLGLPQGKNYQVISLPDSESLNIGRDPDADIKVCDISVSRYNSSIWYDRDID